MAFMDHGLPATVAEGTLGEARVTWTFVPNDDGDSIDFVWDIGHKVSAHSNGRHIADWFVGDPNKATTSRRTVEDSIRRFLVESRKDRT